MSYEPAFGPADEKSGYDLFCDWHAKNAYDIDLTAATLGISRRTAQRWIRKKQIPLATAVLLHQLQHGRALTAAVYRGKWIVNYEWRRQLYRLMQHKYWDGQHLQEALDSGKKAKRIARHKKRGKHNGKS